MEINYIIVDIITLVVGRIRVPQDVYNLNINKKDFTDVIKVRGFRMGSLSCIVRWAQSSYMSS